MSYVVINTDVFLVIAIVVPILGCVGGWFAQRLRVGYVARTIGTALRKGDPLLFLEGHDRRLRLVPMWGGITGFWHHKDAELIPDEKGTYNFYGTEAAMAASHAVSNVNPEFLRYVQAWRTAQLSKTADGKPVLQPMVDVLGRNIGYSPQELARALYDLEREKRLVEDRILMVNRLLADETTVDEIIIQKKITKENVPKFRTEMAAAVADKGEALKKRLDKIQVARTITTKEDGWTIEEEHHSPSTFKLVRYVKLSMDDFWHFLPSGSNMNNLWTMVKRAAEQARLRNEFDEGKGFKWMIIGIVVMMCTIGTGLMVYLIVHG
jgi:hypothetical protein